jgi:spermidine/putrescine transport system permease protein
MTSRRRVPGKRGNRAAGRPWGVMSIPGVAWLALLFVAPLGLVVAMSFGTTGLLGQPEYGWHPRNYLQVFQPVYLSVLLRTFAYAASATAVALVLAYVVCYTVVFRMKRGRTVVLGFILLPWLVNNLVLIYALLELFVSGGLVSNVLHSLGLVGSDGLRGPVAVVLALVYNLLPLMVIPLYASLSQIDASLVEGSRDLYAGQFRTFTRIVVPLSAAGAMAGSLLVFVSALGDFASAQILGGPTAYMVGNLIQDQFSGLASMAVGAGLTVILLALIAVCGALYIRLSRSATEVRGL